MLGGNRQTYSSSGGQHLLTASKMGVQGENCGNLKGRGEEGMQSGAVLPLETWGSVCLC